MTAVVRIAKVRCVTLTEETCAQLRRVARSRSAAITRLADEWDAVHPATAHERQRLFGAAVAAARAAAHMSQGALAAELGLARSTVASWEHGKMLPSDETATAAAVALKTPAAGLLAALEAARRAS